MRSNALTPAATNSGPIISSVPAVCSPAYMPTKLLKPEQATLRHRLALELAAGLRLLRLLFRGHLVLPSCWVHAGAVRACLPTHRIVPCGRGLNKAISVLFREIGVAMPHRYRFVTAGISQFAGGSAMPR